MSKPTPPPPPQKDTLKAPAPKRSINFTAVGLIILVIIIVFGGVFLIRHYKNKKTDEKSSTATISDIQKAFQPPQATSTNPRGFIATSTETSSLYTNTNLGFQVRLAYNWQVKPFSSSEIILSDENGPQLTIETIDNISTNLEGIKSQLTGSPSVKNLAQSSFKNQPALSFNTTSGQQGLAIIYNNRLYYIIGNLSGAPMTDFQFLPANEPNLGFPNNL